jgi:hypothetical protein
MVGIMAGRDDSRCHLRSARVLRLRLRRRSFLLAMGAALIVSSANAQSPSAAPTTGASVTTNAPNPISVNPAPGWDPKMWASTRQECQRLWNKGVRQWTRAEFDEMGACRDMATIEINPNLGGNLAPAASPLPTPVP